MSQGPKTKNAVILAVQPGDNNTRREFLVYVHGHSAKHVAEKIQAVVTAAREDKVGKKPSPKVPVAGVVDSPLDQGLQKKLEELQAAITADEFVQLQFIGGAEIVHRNGHVRLRLTKDQVALTEDEWDELRGKLESLGLIRDTGFNPFGAGEVGVVTIGVDLFRIIPYLREPEVAADQTEKDEPGGEIDEADVVAPSISSANTFWRMLSANTDWLERLILAIWLVWERRSDHAGNEEGYLRSDYLVPRLVKVLGLEKCYKPGSKQPTVVLRWVAYNHPNLIERGREVASIRLLPEAIQMVERLKSAGNKFWSRITRPGFYLDERYVAASNEMWQRVFSKEENQRRLVQLWEKWYSDAHHAARGSDGSLPFAYLRPLLIEEMGLTDLWRSGSAWLSDCLRYLASEEWQVLDTGSNERRYKLGAVGRRWIAEVGCPPIETTVEAQAVTEPPTPKIEVSAPTPTILGATRPDILRNRLATIPGEIERLNGSAEKLRRELRAIEGRQAELREEARSLQEELDQLEQRAKEQAESEYERLRATLPSEVFAALTARLRGE